MSDEIKNETPESNTIVLDGPEENGTQPSVAVPTHEDLKTQGWTKSEIERAEKHGIIPKKKEEKPEVKTDAKAEPEKEVVKDEKAPVKEEKRPVSSLPEFNLSPEQEKVFLEVFGAGTEPRAMYFRMKNERKTRQAAEVERDRALLRMKTLEDELAATRSGQAVKREIDENGNEIEPEDKPLTKKELIEWEKQKEEERAKREAELNERGNRVADALKDQEEYARTIMPDFEQNIELAKEVMQNMEELLPEKWKRDRAIELIRDLQVRAANADKLGVDDWNAPMVSIEIAKMHPNYGKPSNGQRADNDGKFKDPKKANGSLTPEQMKRIEENTQRRTSSASIPGGGGRRTISADEVTLKDLVAMTSTQREEFRKKYPERYALLRG